MHAAYRRALTLLFLSNLYYDDIYCMSRTSQSIPLPSTSIGTRHNLLVHNYGPVSTSATKKAYIQASLHADELPGYTTLILMQRSI